MVPSRLIGRRDVLRLGAASLAGGLLVACGGQGILASDPRAPSQARAGTFRIATSVASPSPAGPAGLVYSCLVAYDPRRSRVLRDLARTVSIDDMTLTFHLNPDLRFHQDSQNLAAALTAQDIVHDFQERAADKEYLFANVIDRVESPNLETVVVHLRAPFSLLFDYLSDPLSAGVRSQVRYTSVDARLGSGPFVPVRRNVEGIGYAANPLFYRRREPLLEGLIVADAPVDRDLDAAFVAGEYDIRVHPRDARPQAGSREGAVLLKRASRRMRGLGLSLLPQKAGAAGGSVRFVAAFRDARVRKAISLALDYDAIAAVDGGILSGPIGPAHAGDALAESDLRKHDLFQRNVEEARTLLAAAGQVDLGFAIEGPNTTTLRAIAGLIDTQLHEAGLAPRVNLLPPADWEPLFLAGDFDAALFELEDLRTPDIALRLHLTGGLSGNFSLWGYSDPVYDNAARQVFTELDPQKRAERARDAQNVLLDQVPAMFSLPAPLEYASVAGQVRGFEFDAYEYNESRLASQWRSEG